MLRQSMLSNYKQSLFIWNFIWQKLTRLKRQLGQSFKGRLFPLRSEKMKVGCWKKVTDLRLNLDLSLLWSNYQEYGILTLSWNVLAWWLRFDWSPIQTGPILLGFHLIFRNIKTIITLRWLRIIENSIGISISNSNVGQWFCRPEWPNMVPE